VAICLKAYPDTNHAWANLLRAAKIKVKDSGQECPLYTGCLDNTRQQALHCAVAGAPASVGMTSRECELGREIPTLRLCSGQAFSQRTREMGHPQNQRQGQNQSQRQRTGVSALHGIFLAATRLRVSLARAE
jgi:hypothetical protein